MAPESEQTHPLVVQRGQRPRGHTVLHRAAGRSSRVVRRHYRVALPRLAPGTPPLRIAHLTDLHIGRVTPEARLEAAVHAANVFAPDLVCLTGDYVGHSLRFLPRLARCLRELEAPAFATMGNHDHWRGAQEVGRALESAGIQVLWNESVRVDLNGQRWRLVGIDDAVTGHHDVEAAFRDRGPEPLIVLSHLAELAPQADERGAALVLSGHTHGGQVPAGGLMPMVMRRMGHQYIAGWYTAGQTAVYVNRGIGAAVFPWRSRHAWSEVALIDLLPAAKGATELEIDAVEAREHYPP